jgi:hypothetical protein
MSESFDLRSLETFRPCDINPHRYFTPAETQRLIDACRAPVQWTDDDASFLPEACDEAHSALTAPVEPFNWHGFLIRLCGLVTFFAMCVGARFLWDTLTLEGRVVAGCFAAWAALVAVRVWAGGQGR